MQFPILSVIIFLPLLAGVAILFLPDRHKLIFNFSLAVAFITFILSGIVYFGFDVSAGGTQFIDEFMWVKQLGIQYKVGVDGITTPLVFLTGIVMFTGVIISRRITDRPREFFAFMFLLAAGVFGVFVALDLFVLFFFYEIAVFPMYLLIVIWGWVKTREYAAMKLTLYLFIGSVIALVGALAMYFKAYELTGVYSFEITHLANALKTSVGFQQLWFPFVFVGFAVLGGMFPFHNWSPEGHVAAPTAVSMFHAGVLMKLGAFAAFKIGIYILPRGAEEHMWWVILLTLVNVVYGALIAMRQKDLKFVIGFSSVSHMGLVVMGFATLTFNGFVGASIQMVSHGLMTALFFASVGMIYDQAHTRQRDELGGISKVMPIVTGAFIVGGLVSMGMPGFSGFVAEFPIFMGVWETYPWIAIVGAVSIVITAAYIIRIILKVFFGDIPEKLVGHLHDVTLLEKGALLLLAGILVIIGIFPQVIVPMVEVGVTEVLEFLQFGGV